MPRPMPRSTSTAAMPISNRRNAPTPLRRAKPLRSPTPPGRSGWPLEGAGRALPGGCSARPLQRPKSYLQNALGCSAVVSRGICFLSAPRDSNPPSRYNLQAATLSRWQHKKTIPSWAQARRGATAIQPQSCFGAPPRAPRHGTAGKNAHTRFDSTRTLSEEAQGNARNACRPGCSPGRHWGRRGPDHSGHGDPAALRRRSCGWQASAGQRGVYARTGAGLCLTAGPRPWGRQPAWPGPAPVHWLSSHWTGSRWR